MDSSTFIVSCLCINVLLVHLVGTQRTCCSTVNKPSTAVIIDGDRNMENSSDARPNAAIIDQHGRVYKGGAADFLEDDVGFEPFDPPNFGMYQAYVSQGLPSFMTELELSKSAGRMVFVVQWLSRYLLIMLLVFEMMK